MCAVKQTVKPAVTYFAGGLGAILVISEVVAMLETAAMFDTTEMPGAMPATPIPHPIPQIISSGYLLPDEVVGPSGVQFEPLPQFTKPYALPRMPMPPHPKLHVVPAPPAER